MCFPLQSAASWTLLSAFAFLFGMSCKWGHYVRTALSHAFRVVGNSMLWTFLCIYPAPLMDRQVRFQSSATTAHAALSILLFWAPAHTID